MQGSSPQVRGTLRRGCESDESGGLIPAGAGNIPKVAVADSDVVGSSPQVRGTYSLNWEYYALAECFSPVALLSRFTSGIATSVMPS